MGYAKNIILLKEFVNDGILRPAELIKYAQILPAKEGYFLLSGIKYQTGSDYSEEKLNQKIGDLADISGGKLSDYHRDNCSGCSLCEL